MRNLKKHLIAFSGFFLQMSIISPAKLVHLPGESLFLVQNEKTGIQIWNLKGLMTLYQVTLHLNSNISVDHKPPNHTLTSCRLYQSKSKPNNFSDSISLPRARSLHRKWLCSSRTLEDDMLADRCLMLNSYLIDRYFSLHMTTNIGDVKLSNNLVYGRNDLRQRKIQTVKRKFFY